MKHLFYFIVVSVVIYVGCSADITHPMDDMLKEISKNIDYERQTITTEVTVKKIERGTANEDRLHLVTNRSDYIFSILADKGKYKKGETYKFMIYIEKVEKANDGTEKANDGTEKANDGTSDPPSPTCITGRTIKNIKLRDRIRNTLANLF